MLANARRAWRLRKVRVKLGGPSPKLLRRPSGKTISKGVRDWVKRLRIRSIRPVERWARTAETPGVLAVGKVGSFMFGQADKVVQIREHDRWTMPPCC